MARSRPPLIRIALLAILALVIGSAALSHDTPLVHADAFLPTGSLTIPRSDHSAVLLQDGSVLAIGGVVESPHEGCPSGFRCSGRSVERWSPGTSRWTQVASMTTARNQQRAGRLENGMVAVTGGYSGNTVTSSVEVYNPANNTWSTKTPMTTGRAGHTAWMLSGNKMLLVGGATPGNPSQGLASIEIYDVNANSTSAKAPMNGARLGHTMTTLADGRFLVAGGEHNGASLDTAEIYNLTTNTWTAAGAMKSRRSGHIMIRMANGKVLAAGGVDFGTGQILKTAEVYDPATNSWTLVGEMSQPRIFAQANTLNGGQVLITGGYNGIGTVAASEIFDPTLTDTATGRTGRFGLAAGDVQSRYRHRSTVMPDGTLLMSGGSYVAPGGNSQSNVGDSSFWVYNATSTTWTQTIQVGGLTITADVIERKSGIAEAYTLRGSVAVGGVLKLTGSRIDVTVNRGNVSALFIVDGGAATIDLPFHGDTTLWRGPHFEFSIDGNGTFTQVAQAGASALRAAGVDITVSSAKLLLVGDPGIQINGTLNFPAIGGMSGFNANFSQLEYRRHTGMAFTGAITLPQVNIGGFQLSSASLLFDAPSRTFQGSGTLTTPMFNLSTSVKVVAGQLDSVVATVSGFEVPLGPIVVTGGSIGVSNLRTGPFAISLGVDMTVAQGWVKNLLELKATGTAFDGGIRGITYTYPSNLNGLAGINLFGQQVGDVQLGINFQKVKDNSGNLYDQGEVSFKGELTLPSSNLQILVISASAKAGYWVDTSGGLHPYFSGRASGRLQIPLMPSDNGGPNDKFNQHVQYWCCQLPHTIASVDVGIDGGKFFAEANLGWAGKYAVVVEGANGGGYQYRFAGSLRDLGISGATAALPAGGVQRTANGGVRVAAQATDGAQVIGSFTVAPGTPAFWTRVTATTGSGAPHLTLISPSNVRIPWNLPGANGNYLPNLNTALREARFAIQNPEAGVWQVEVEDNDLCPCTLDGLGADAPPALSNVTATSAGAIVAVGYNASDAESTGGVALYYDTDGDGFDGTQIAEDLPLSAAGSHQWNTAGIPSGVYHIYAVVDDGVNAPVRVYAPGTVNVVDPLAPSTPGGVSVSGGPENSLLVSWSPSTGATVKNYLIRYGVEAGANTVLDQAIDAGTATSFRIPGLENSTTYRVSVTAFSETLENDPSAPGGQSPVLHRSLPSATATGTTATAIPPVVTVTSPAANAQLANGRAHQIGWSLAQGDDVTSQTLELSTDGGMTWTAIASTTDGAVRTFNWDAPADLISANARLRLTARDQAGNSGSATVAVGFVVPAPSVQSVSPASVLEDQPVALTLTGSDFKPDTVVRVGSTATTVEYVTGGRLIVEVPASALQTPGTATITVENGDGRSTSTSLTVREVPPAGVASITSTVALQGRSGMSPGNVPVTVAIEGGASVTADSSGLFTLPLTGLDANSTYTITASAPGYLPASRQITLSGGTPLVDPAPVMLRAGRVVPSATVVDISQITRLIAAFGRQTADRTDGLGNTVDINGDGVVNILDVTLALGNFGRTAPQEWPAAGAVTGAQPSSAAPGRPPVGVLNDNAAGR